METFRRDHSLALSIIRNFALLVGLLLPGEQLYAQEVDKDGLYSQPFLVLDPEMHTNAIRGMSADSAGRYIATASYDKTVRVWSAENGSLVRTVRLPSGPTDVGKAIAVAVSPDGRFIAAGGWTVPGAFSIFLFERLTGREVARIGPFPSYVVRLAYSPDGRRIAATFGGRRSREWSVRLFDVESRTQIALDSSYTDPIYGLVFEPTGMVATASKDGKLRLYDHNLKLVRLTALPRSDPYSIAFSPDGGRLAVGYDDSPPRVDVVDGRTLETLSTPDTGSYRGSLPQVAWSLDGGTLYAGGSVQAAGNVAVLAWTNGGQGSNRIIPTSIKTRISGIRELSGGRLAVSSFDPSVSLFDRTGASLWSAESRGADFRSTRLEVSADGKRILFGFALGAKTQATFDVGQRAFEPDAAPISGLVVARTSGLPIVNWRNSYSPQIRERLLMLENREMSRSLAIASDARSFWLGADWSLRHFDATGALIRHLDLPGVAWAVNLASEDRLVIAAHSDGTIRWYRSADGAELLAFYSYSNPKQWVAWTPLGHYAASPGAEDFIQGQVNRGLDQEPATFSASRFRDRFYRPDVIERVLDLLDPQKAVDAADDAAGRGRTMLKSIAEHTPPRVAIVDPADSTFVDRPEIVVAYTIEDHPGTIIRRIRLMLDGRVVAEQQNGKIPANGRLVGEFRVQLQGEQPVLTLLADSDHGASDPSSVRIRRNATTDTHKSTLYVLAIGIGRFKSHPHLKLNFADADANAFVNRLRQQERGLYKRVEVLSLVNEEATGQAILKGLEWLERSMGARDVAAVFFSSHGANDANRELYLLPHDVNVEDDITLRRTGVRYLDLRATLIRLAERGKTLLFLDACHSGNVLSGTKGGSLDIDGVAADLASAENGVVVFSSSTGKQFSIEYPALGHGAFTAALLEAFDGKSDRPPPWLRVSDLDIWLAARVKELTKGAQTPTTTIPGERFTNPRVFMVQQPRG
jgi:WD40 repeat protein